MKKLSGGNVIEVPSKSLHVGDVLYLEENEEIPCDCVVLYSSNANGIDFAVDPKTGEIYSPEFIGRKQETAALRRSVLFILNETARLEAEVSAAVGVYPETASDILDQLAWLVFDGFVAAVPPDRLERYPLWLRGIEERLARARNNPAGDLRKLASLAPAVRRYTDFVTAARKPRYDAVALDRYRWMLEDCRLAVFCPDLAAREAGLPAPSRLTAAWADVDAL